MQIGKRLAKLYCLMNYFAYGRKVSHLVAIGNFRAQLHFASRCVSVEAERSTNRVHYAPSSYIFFFRSRCLLSKSGSTNSSSAPFAPSFVLFPFRWHVLYLRISSVSLSILRFAACCYGNVFSSGAIEHQACRAVEYLRRLFITVALERAVKMMVFLSRKEN